MNCGDKFCTFCLDLKELEKSFRLKQSNLGVQMHLERDFYTETDLV